MAIVVHPQVLQDADPNCVEKLLHPIMTTVKIGEYRLLLFEKLTNIRIAELT